MTKASVCPAEHYSDPERPRKAADGAVLCHGCIDRLEAQLLRLPEMFDDVLIAKRGARTAPTTGTKDPPAVVTHEQLEARWLVRNTLVGWCRVVDEERGATLPPDTIEAMCGFLRRHSLWLTAHDCAPEFADSINYCHREAHRVAYPSRRERQYIGDCPIEIEHPDTQELGPCGEKVYAYPGESEVQCSKCGTKDTVEQWFRWLVQDDRDVTGGTLAALLSQRYLVPVRPSLIRLWASRGKIERVGTDPLGRSLYDFDAVVVYADTLYPQLVDGSAR